MQLRQIFFVVWTNVSAVSKGWEDIALWEWENNASIQTGGTCNVQFGHIDFEI